MRDYETYIKKARITLMLILASHAHHVPQVGCPHNDPVTIAKQVNIRPIGAILLVNYYNF